MPTKRQTDKDQPAGPPAAARHDDALVVPDSAQDQVPANLRDRVLTELEAEGGTGPLIVPDSAAPATETAEAAEESVPMPTTTAENRNHAQATSATQAASEAAETVQQQARAQAAEAVETTRATSLAAYDAFVDAYLATVKLGLQTQARGLALTRQVADEMFSAQDEVGDLAEQWVTSGRKLQQTMLEATESTVRTMWGGWYREPRRD